MILALIIACSAPVAAILLLLWRIRKNDAAAQQHLAPEAEADLIYKTNITMHVEKGDF